MIKAGYSDRKTVIDILCSSFEKITTPNSINFIINRKGNRKRRLRVLMEYLFDNTLFNGDIFLSNNKKCCVLIQYPHKKRKTFRTFLWDLKLIIKCIGFFNVPRVLKRQKALDKFHPKEPHIHPIIIAVERNFNKKGIGLRLIKEVFDNFNTNNLPVIIETTTDENLKLYKYFGFKIFKETNEFNYPLYFLKKK